MNLAAKCLLLAGFFIGAHAPALAADSETFGKYCQRIKAPEEIEPLTEEQVQETLDFIRTLADETIAAVSDDTSTKSDLRDQFDELVERGFAVEYISSRVLPKYCNKAKVNEHIEYTTLFRTYLREYLLGQLSSYTDETIDIVGHTVTKRNDVFVKSQIVFSNDAIDVDWRVRRFDEELKIIDVVLEGVSMAVTYREDFRSIAFSDGVEGLIAILRERAEETEAEASLADPEPLIQTP